MLLFRYSKCFFIVSLVISNPGPNLDHNLSCFYVNCDHLSSDPSDPDHPSSYHSSPDHLDHNDPNYLINTIMILRTSF